jgi:hypothetical protein
MPFEDLARPRNIREAMERAALAQGVGPRDIPQPGEQPVQPQQPQEEEGMFGRFLGALAAPFTSDRREQSFNRSLDLSRQLGQAQRQVEDRKQAQGIEKALAVLRARQDGQPDNVWTGFSAGEGGEWGVINRQTGEFRPHGKVPMKPRANGGEGGGRSLTPTAAFGALQRQATRDFPPDTIDPNTNRPAYTTEQASRLNTALNRSYAIWLEDPTRNPAKAWSDAKAKLAPEADPTLGGAVPDFTETPTPIPVTPAKDATGQSNFVMRPEGEQPTVTPQFKDGEEKKIGGQTFVRKGGKWLPK